MWTHAHTHTLPGNVHASPWVHKEVSVHDKYMINSVNMTHEPTIIIRNANIRTETNKFREEFAHIKQGLVPKHTWDIQMRVCVSSCCHWSLIIHPLSGVVLWGRAGIGPWHHRATYTINTLTSRDKSESPINNYHYYCYDYYYHYYYSSSCCCSSVNSLIPLLWYFGGNPHHLWPALSVQGLQWFIVELRAEACCKFWYGGTLAGRNPVSHTQFNGPAGASTCWSILCSSSILL